MTVFRWILLSLCCFRATRVVTTDDWPPSDKFRNWVKTRTGKDSAWYTLVTCNWCAGLYIAGPIYLVDTYVWRIPTLLLMFGATLTIVGLIGNHDE